MSAWLRNRFCPKCDGAGWVWADELHEYSGEGSPRVDDTKYQCDHACPERAMCLEAAEEIERLRAAQQDAREALRDCIGYMKGDIAGPMQRDGIIKDAEAVLDRLR